MNMYFAAPSDAIGFLNHLAELKLRALVCIYMLFSPTLAWSVNIDTLANAYSLAHTLPDVYLERIMLDDERPHH
jgi:hypothetical protein